MFTLIPTNGSFFMAFKKGYIPWNKGMKGFRTKGSFKKGEHFSIKTEFKNGRKDPNWPGDGQNYRGIHRWVYKNLGKANHCDNPECFYPRKDKHGRLMLAPKRYEWSNISRRYKMDLSDWQQLCVSCHHFYDNVI